MEKKVNPRHNRQYRNARKEWMASSRSGETCAECGGWVDKTMQHSLPDSPELDHIVPLARGGKLLDSDNFQLVHKKCNVKKGHGVTAAAKAKPRNETMVIFLNEENYKEGDWSG